MNNLKKIYYLLNREDRIKSIYIFFLLLISTLLEILGVGLVIPFVQMLTSDNLIDKYPLIFENFEILNTLSRDELILYGITSFVLFFLVKTVFLAIVHWIKATFILNIVSNYSKKLFEGYMHNPYSFHLNRNSADLIKNCSSLIDVFSAAVTSTFILFLEVLILIGISFFLFYVSPIGASILILIVILSSYIFYNFNKKRFSIWGKQALFHDGLKIQSLQEGLGGIKEIKILGTEGKFVDRFSYHNFIRANMSRYRDFAQNLPRFFLELLAVFSILVLLFVMILQGFAKEDYIWIVAVFGAAAIKIMPSSGRILFSFQNLRYCKPGLDLYLEEKIKINKNKSQSQNKEFIFNNKIAFKNICFKYNTESEFLLEDVTLTIKENESFGFVGESGSGKTTFVDILLGLLTPQKGQILVDGIDISENIHGWQKLIGYVPQNIYLADTSLKKNIALGQEEKDININNILKAVNLAQLDDLVKKFPKGIDTTIGEMGVRLSGGERQRIGIARSLYRNPKVLILDEATSSLDIETEKKFMKCVNELKGRKTLITISHRYSTIKDCDQIFEVKNKKILPKNL